MNFGPLTLGCKLGPYTIEFNVSDPDNCTTTYTLTLTGKNTKPKFDPLLPPAIADFTQAINELKTFEIKEIEDNENSTLTLTCWKMLVGAETTIGLIKNERKVDPVTKK